MFDTSILSPALDQAGTVWVVGLVVASIWLLRELLIRVFSDTRRR